MRRTIKGAAALAALCAGALAFAPAASATGDSESTSAMFRIAGIDRIQTSLEALDAIETDTVTTYNVFVVGYNGVVDALSLAPLAKKMDVDGAKSAVVYTLGNKLDKRVSDELVKLGSKTGVTVNVYVIGGTGVVSDDVYQSIMDLKKTGSTDKAVASIHRIGGKDRYATSYQVGAWAADMTNVKAAADNLTVAEKAKADYEKALADYTAKNKAKHDAAKAKNDAAKAFTDASTKYNNVLAGMDNSDETLPEANAKVRKAIGAASAAADKSKNYADLMTALNKFTSKYADKDNTDFATAMNEQADIAKEIAANPLTAKGGPQAALVSKDDDGKYNHADKLSAVLSAVKTEADAADEAATAATAGIKDAMNDAVEHAQKIAANDKAIQDPKSDFNVARVAYNDASKAQKDADKADSDAATALEKAKNAYTSAVAAYDPLAISEDQTAYDEAVANAYKAGNFNIFLSTGTNFADALTTGPAAASMSGIVLLTQGSTLGADEKAAVEASSKTVYTIGGPAAAAYANSVSVVGADRYETSAKVATKWFANKGGSYALTSGQTGADAVVAGVFLGSLANGKGVLLTQQDKLPASVANFISYGDNKLQNQEINFYVFGGEQVVSAKVANAAYKAAGF